MNKLIILCGLVFQKKNALCSEKPKISAKYSLVNQIRIVMKNKAIWQTLTKQLVLWAMIFVHT